MKSSENPPTTPATKGASNGITTSTSASGDVTTAQPTITSTSTTNSSSNNNSGKNVSSNIDGNAVASSNNSTTGNNGTKAKPAALSVNTSTANGDGAMPATTTNGTKGRRDRPCDACRRRKSRCVMNEGAEICVLCQFHSQECTFVQSPQPRKRRLASSNVGSEDQAVIKKRSTEPESPQETAIRGNMPVDDYASLRGPSLLKTTLGLQGHRHSQLIGPTSEYESCLIDLCPFDQKDEYMLSSAGGSFRRASDEITFLMFPDHPTQNHGEIFDDLDAIERIVAPHGQSLISLYFRIVHPSFPILHKKVFLEKYSRTHREFSPPLLAAVYILALHWWSYDRDLSPQKKPDVAALEKLASKTIADVMHRPKLAAVQAGLLLLQRHSDLKGGSWALTCQLVAVGQELGLHLNCEGWKIPPWERGLRKRLAWGLFMQDKWGALTHGRPSHITRSNWAVPAVTAEDFPENAADEDDEEGSSEVEKGRMLFEQMINLSGIMADVLETFFTLEAQQSLAGRGGTNRVLEKAKPIQIRLKEWFSKLPECLRMDATKVRKLSSNGYLHLAYFATEITLHRQILRSLSPPTNTESYIHHICRSAAKTRLISAMDFVNRLKPEHLQSFWYFASKVNFALIGTFGSLLWATSPNTQEAEFYKARLSEYRWTLRVSSRGAEFMEYAVGVLDASAGYLQQEQFRKRGLGNATPGYTSTVGAGENFGLGMGVGLNPPSSLSVPPPPPLSHSEPTLPPQWHGPDVTHNERDGHLSPITGYDSEVDDDGEMTDGSSTSSRRRLNSSSASPSMKAYQGFPFVDSGPTDPLATNASTPTSTTSSAFDFFMIPNGMPGSRMQGAEAAGVTRGELDFLATTAGWRSRRDGDD
ncbi:hypothetical protein HOY80DRAFT_1052048 [Tuber brumale]|nr:hypothetical protein HOY80DRAFT_1052048 [Tuber brumale]